MLPTISRRGFRPFWSGFFDDDFFPVTSGKRSANSMPPVNIREDEKDYFLELAVPGLDKKDLKIDIHEDVLTVSHETKTENEEEDNGYKRREFSFTSFSRTFYIPDNVDRDKIQASYKDGVLSVDFPKREPEKNKISKEVKIS